MVKTSSSSARGVQFLIGELRSHTPGSQKTKTENRNNIVTNSIMTLKIVHIQKNLKKKKIILLSSQSLKKKNISKTHQSNKNIQIWSVGGCGLLWRILNTGFDSEMRNITLESYSAAWPSLSTIMKAECQRIDAFELWCWRRLLRVPWTAKKSNQSVLKEINPEYSLQGQRSLVCYGYGVAKS